LYSLTTFPHCKHDNVAPNYILFCLTILSLSCYSVKIFAVTACKIKLRVKIYCHDLWVCDYRWGVDWILDLLTTCIHHLELHITVHWHTQTRVLSVLWSPLAVSWQRLLPREILQLPAFRSSCHSCPCRSLVKCNSTGSRAGSHFTPTS
jgi:hypothetical protein